MFQRFTDRARRIVVLAQEEARAHNHPYIGTEHLLLGIVREADGRAVRVLTDFGVDLDDLRARIDTIIGQGEYETTAHIPFTPQAKKVLEVSLQEALHLGHGYIGTEHILLGLSREREGIAGQVLNNRGLTYPVLRRQVSLLVDVETSGTGGTGGAVGPMSSAEVYDANALKKRLILIRARLDRIEQRLRAGDSGA
jgi:ATP-dependent Clp protease ATP-binding subunit ClpC